MRNASRGLVYGILLLLSLLLYSCSSNGPIENNNNSSKIDTLDDQYCFVKTSNPAFTFIASEAGYYYFSGLGHKYMYYTDKANMKTSVLCNKPDCLHAYERDPLKVMYCNAFFAEPFIDVGNLLFYDSFLYFFEDKHEWNKPAVNRFIQLSADGTQRKEVFTFKDMPQDVIIHRGYLYYSMSDNGTVLGKEDSTVSKTGIYRIPMNDLSKVPELIYEKEGIYANICEAAGYKDNVFFTCTGFADSKLQVSTSSLMSYNITSGKASIVSEQAGKYAICADKIVYYWNDGKQGRNYICDLDGSNNKPLEHVIGLPYSDDSFIITNTSFLNFTGMKDINGNPIKRLINIYNLEGKMIQSLNVEEYGEVTLLGSDSNYIFLKEVAPNEFGLIDRLYSIDKRKTARGNATLDKLFEFIPEFESPGIQTK